jgi:formylglycine-generating enzyme required for sulfatase activity
MTHPRIPRLKPFSAVLLTAILLTAAQVALVPVAFGQNAEKGASSNEASSNEASGDAAIVGQLTLDLGKGVSMKLVLIPAGKFMMGNHETPAETVKKVGGFERNMLDEYPAHEVTISKLFYMGIYEVTQAQWKAVMGTEPWKAERALGYMRAQPRPQGFDDYPVAFVDSYDAIEFCRKLSKKTGITVSLPSVAQWEYACRAGTTTTFSFGDDLSKLIDYGWYGGKNAGQKEDYAHRVGQLKPNPWGLYDMHGNVWEFCRDWYDKDYYSRSPSVDPENTMKTDRVSLRSGAFHSVPSVSRSAKRNNWAYPKSARYNYGIRVIVAADK